jgi:hypothetical protein
LKTTDPGPRDGPFSRGRKMADELSEHMEWPAWIVGSLILTGVVIGMTSGIDAVFMKMVGVVLFLTLGVPSLIFLVTRSAGKFLEACACLFWLARNTVCGAVFLCVMTIIMFAVYTVCMTVPPFLGTHVHWVFGTVSFYIVLISTVLAAIAIAGARTGKPSVNAQPHVLYEPNLDGPPI